VPAECQTDHEAAVVAEVGGPPVLRRRQDVVDVRGQRVEVDRPERLGVVEVVVHRVGHPGVRAQHAQVQMVRPPVDVAAALGRVRETPAVDRAAAGLVRVHLRLAGDVAL
jgi:hypothetical protein